MNSVRGSYQNLLIVGGTASISKDIIRIALEKEYKITATFRNKPSHLDPNVDWMELDIANETSIKDFQTYIKNKQFSLIIYLIGELSLSEPNKEKYLITNLVNAIFVIENLKDSLDIKKNSVLLYMSSRAAIYPSFDLYYSIVKASLTAVIRSLSLRLSKNQKMFSLAPGLIIGSSMYETMLEDVRNSHHMRSDNNLLDMKALASEIFRIIDNQEVFENGSIIEVGPKYK
jgi:NAD(P)-dependent dehydrogenase (short-subunit alcohol dehydrogenase family)